MELQLNITISYELVSISKFVYKPGYKHVVNVNFQLIVQSHANVEHVLVNIKCSIEN